MSWIKVNLSLRNNPKLVTVASQISATRCAALGAICHAWMVADEHADENGIVKFMSSDMLDGLCECPGLAAAMAKVGWLTILDGSLQFPEYQEHNGATGKQRAGSQKRMSKHRNGSVTVDRNTPVTVERNKSVTRGEERREDKRREEQTDTSSSAVGKPPSEKVAWNSDSGWTGITEKTRAMWNSAFPACDIDTELARMSVWLSANPAKARKSNWERFANGWLTKSQDSGGGMKSAKPAVDFSVIRYSDSFPSEFAWMEWCIGREEWMAANGIKALERPRQIES